MGRLSESLPVLTLTAALTVDRWPVGLMTLWIFVYSSLFSGQFLPRDAYIQRLCYDLMSVCSSVCHKPVFYQNGWTYLAVFDTGYFWQFILCYTLLCGISSISNNKATSLCNLLPA